MGVADRFFGPIEADEAAAVLAGYDLPGPVRVRARHLRWLFAVGRCSAGGRELVLKRQPPAGRLPGQVRWQHRVIEHLAKRGVPAARPLVRRDGDTLTQLGGYWYEAFEPAAGEDVYAGIDTWEPFASAAHAAAAGSMLAALHDAGGDFRPLVPQPQRGFVVQLDAVDCGPAPAVARIARSRPGLRRYLRSQPRWRAQVQEAYAERFEALRPLVGRLPRGPLHGDWQTNNLFFDGHRVSGIIDFHQADAGPRLLDLAVAVERNCFFWNRISAGDDGALALDDARVLIEAYHERLALRDVEREALADVVAACQFEYGLSFLDYYAGVEGDAEKADWAWSTYVLGHARWFLGEAGRRAHAQLAQIAADLDARRPGSK
jgi:Ser/Thr protein kinase RdoA (MazF antagonist)